MKEETAQRILHQTKQNYQTISQDWDRTRQQLWPGFGDFIPYVEPGDKILDIGCGNGRLVELFKKIDIDYTGLDNSTNLLDIARQKFPDNKFIFGDLLNLPFDKNSFDKVFCIGVLHHIPGSKLRHQAVKEINRVLNKDGLLFLMNWHYSSPKFLSKLAKFTLTKLTGKSELDFGDIEIGWGHTGLERYIHIFTKIETSNLLSRHGFKVIKNYTSEYSRRGFRNIVTIAKKC